MRLTVTTIQDVADRQLCCGCGVCAYLDPVSITMLDALESGRRPRVESRVAEHPRQREDMQACPGIRLEHRFASSDAEPNQELLPDWGPVYEVWEGFATDSQIRHAGSSGGAASALALFAIEHAGMHGVLHITARTDIPYLNKTVLSRTRAELLARTGSRYAPASPCDGLQQIEDAPGPCVFIGKPCDVAGATMAAKLRPRLAEKLGLTIAFFCAGTPTTRATLGLLKKMGVDDPSRILSLRYRGNGWPGRFTVQFVDAAGRTQEGSLSYEESWEFLTNDKQWRCHICPDHTGEFADIAVGDPWYRPVQSGELGKSLIVARTQRGREFLHAAAKAGYVVLETRDATLLPRSQPNLLRTRGAVWGRLLALRLAGVPTPQFPGFQLFRAWLRLPLSQKTKSILGTWRRIGQRGLRQRRPIEPMTTKRVGKSAFPAPAVAVRGER